MSIPRITEILEDHVGIDGQNFETDQGVKRTQSEMLELILLELQKLNLSIAIAFDIDIDSEAE